MESVSLFLHTGHTSISKRDSRIPFLFVTYDIFSDLSISDRIIITIPVKVIKV